MADRARGQAQRDRADARGRRRSLAARPFEQLAESGPSRDANDSDRLGTAKRALRTAAGAAIAGGLAGAAKAFVDRRGRRHEDDEAESQAEERDVPLQDASAAEAANEEEEAATESDSDAQPTDAAEPEAGEPDMDQRDEHTPQGGDEESQRGASSSDVAAMVDRARREVANLLGKEPEGVSGLNHTNGSWFVTVEVVDIHRIPDSTDILSSYEVVLDEDGNLVRLDRQRRYRRSQVEEE
jgi:hypothetical protein